MSDPIDAILDPEAPQGFDPVIRERLSDAAVAAMAVLHPGEEQEVQTIIILLTMNGGEVMLSSNAPQEILPDILLTAAHSVVTPDPD